MIKKCFYCIIYDVFSLYNPIKRLKKKREMYNFVRLIVHSNVLVMSKIHIYKGEFREAGLIHPYFCGFCLIMRQAGSLPSQYLFILAAMDSVGV